MPDTDKSVAILRVHVLQIISLVLRRMSATRQLCAESLSRYIPQAGDEMKAVIKGTEDATNSILGSCEKIQRMLIKENSYNPKVKAEITSIMEACSFQDITRQRITKASKTMDTLSAKITELMRIIDGRFVEIARATNAERVKPVTDQELMQGPGEGLSQNEVDKLLDIFKKREGI